MAERSPSMRGQPGPPAAPPPAAVSIGSTSGAMVAVGTSAVSHLPQAHNRLPPAGICAVSPHLHLTETSSLFMKMLGSEGGVRNAAVVCHVTASSGRGHLFSLRQRAENLSRRQVTL